MDITYTEAATAAGALALCGCGLGVWAVFEIRHTRAALRRLIERDSVRGIGRLADELQTGYTHLRDTQGALERLAISVAETGGTIRAEARRP